MFSYKRIKHKGFSIIYGIILGMICVIAAVYLLSVECQRKKYMLEFQKAEFKTKNNNCDIYME